MAPIFFEATPEEQALIARYYQADKYLDQEDILNRLMHNHAVVLGGQLPFGWYRKEV